MEFYEVIKERKTIRDLQDKAIPDEVLHRILNAALRAPANGRARTWEFVVLKNAEDKAKVLDRIPKKVTSQEVIDYLDEGQIVNPVQRATYMKSIPKQFSMLYESGCVVLPLFRQDWALLEPEKINDLNNFASVWCCIENILLAATAEGLGANLRIPFPEEVPFVKEAVGYPDNYVMPCYLAMGYPVEHYTIFEEERVELEDRIHIGKWK